LIPLWFSGARRSDAFPASLLDLLVRDFTHPEKYYEGMTKQDGPVGLIPSLFKLQHDRSYLSFVDLLNGDFERIANGKLTVAELNRQRQVLDETSSSVSHPTPEVKPPPELKNKSTLAEGIDVEGELDMSGMTAAGATVNLQDLQHEDQANAVLQGGLKSVVERQNEAVGLKGVSVKKGAKVNASKSTSTGAAYSMNFAPVASATEKPRAARPLNAADTALTTRIRTVLDENYPETDEGNLEYRTEILEALAGFVAASQRQALRPQLEEYLQALLD